MKPNTSTCPTGVIGVMRMITKGTKVKMSRTVRRRICTSRGRSVVPNAARRNKRMDAPMSDPSKRTPRTMNVPASRIVKSASSAVKIMRSLATSSDMATFGSSLMANRSFMSGISMASFDKSSSSMSSDS